MQFQGKHGYYEHELTTPQPFEVDVELVLNIQPAGIDDDLEKTIDYGKVYEATRQIVESTSFRLLEALAEAISHELLADFTVTEVGIRIRKPNVDLGGPLDHARVEIWRRRPAGERRT
jgi:dihydroneopterin aldolase